MLVLDAEKSPPSPKGDGRVEINEAKSKDDEVNYTPVVNQTPPPKRDLRKRKPAVIRSSETAAVPKKKANKSCPATICKSVGIFLFCCFPFY